MNQAGIWLVVKPSVGLPLFLGAVTTIALLVHAAILTHTTWFGGYWQGKAKPAAAAMIDGPAKVAVAPTATQPQ
jgi:light-harvesting protein B-800-850 alpha chain